MKKARIDFRTAPEFKDKIGKYAKVYTDGNVSSFIEMTIQKFMEEKEMTTVEKAMAMDEFENDLPELEVGQICKMKDVWDGNGDVPEGSYSYQLTDSDWINYSFKLLEEQESNPLETAIKITDISLL